MSTSSHLSKDLFELIKSIGESKSKQEEDKIITQEVTVLRSKISQARVPDKKMKELLIRAIYIEMLGHDASFAYIHAINSTQSSNMLNKRIGYLTCGLCLAPDSDLLILLIAALQRDLQSTNQLAISAALSAVSKLANAGMMHAVHEPVVRLLSHESEVIRKKAVMVLHKFAFLNPGNIAEYAEHFRKALCDKDPAVMGATLNFFLVALHDEHLRTQFKDLTASFVVILKQIVDHRLPREFDYHRMPAPWLQVKLLEVLAFLGQDDQRASEQMYEILHEVMRRADDTGINAGYAIVYQCLKTITSIYPNSKLLESAAHCISRFVTSDNHNLKYTGITGLISIVKIDPTYAAKHQLEVVECLEDPDDTLKRNTLHLLFRMTNPHNVQPIVEKMKSFLASPIFDSHLKSELVSRITELAEKYAPDPRWYLLTINSVFELAGEHIKPDIVSNLVRLIDEWRDEPESIAFATQEYLRLLQQTEVVSDVLMQTAAWVLGEFGDTLEDTAQAEVMTLLCKALHARFEQPTTKGWILTALLKLGKGVPSPEVRELVSKFSFSKNEDLQQRCYEFAGICTRVNQCLSFKENLGMNFDNNLSFLDAYVQEQLGNGARPYDSTRNRRRQIMFPIEHKPVSALESLRVEAYEAPRVETRTRPQAPDELRVSERIWTKEGHRDLVSSSKPAQPEVPRHDPVPVAAANPGPWQPRAPPPRSQKELERERMAQLYFTGLSGDPPPNQPNQANQYPPPNQPTQGSRNSAPTNLLDL